MPVRRSTAAFLLLFCLFLGASIAEGRGSGDLACCCARHRGRFRRSCVSARRCQCVRDAVSPQGADQLVAQGDSLREKDDPDGAIAAYTKAIRLDPKCGKAYCGRGEVLGEKGNIEAAMADLNEAIRLDPKNAAAHNAHGCGYASERDFEKAIADFSHAIRLDPKLVPAYDNRAGLRGERQLRQGYRRLHGGNSPRSKE